MTNYLVVIRNKKLNIDMSGLSAFLRVFASACVHFDKISFVGFDSSKTISEALADCKSCSENAVVLCCAEQKDTIAGYLERLYSAAFDGRTYLNCGGQTVFLGLENEGTDFASACVSALNKKYGVCYDKFYIKCVSAPAELIRSAIAKAGADCGDICLAVYDDFGDQTIEASYSSNTPKMVADRVRRVLVAALDDYIYALENISLERRLYDLLRLRRMTISVAESFTGGGIASRLVSVPGVSEVYYEGLNTYANGSKMSRLGVDEMTLKSYGAVSDRTALEMAEGLLATGKCQLAVATTGIAGPKSDNTAKPVGLAYIAAGTRDNLKVYKFNYVGDRERITRTAINDALFLAYRALK